MNIDELIKGLHSRKIDAAVLFAKPALSFAPGDVVLRNGKEEIIFMAEADGGVVEYATTSGAWYSADILTLIRRADEETLKIACDSDQDEEEEDDEEDFDDVVKH